MEPGEEIVYLLQHISLVMIRQSDQILMERLGIGLSQLRILSMLEHQPDVQQRQLADSLGQTEASISRQIKLLQEKGMLTVRINPKSRREHLALPTAKGFKMTEAAVEVLAEHHAPMIELLSNKQRDQLKVMLTTFHNHTCASGKLFACDHSFDVISQHSG